MEKIIIIKLINMSAKLFSRLLILCFFSQAIFAGTSAQRISHVIVSVSGNNTTLSEAIKSIEGQTDFKFAFSKEIIEKHNKIISINKSNKSLKEVLESISYQTGLTFKQINKTISVKTNADYYPDVKKSVKNGKVIGKVTETTTGEPLIGANLLISGSKIGTVTDIDGAFELFIPEEMVGTEITIVVKYVGYKTSSETVPITDRTLELNFELDEDIFLSEEVVVTGIASKTSKSIAEVSVSRVDAEALNAKSGYQSVTQMVTGKISGVQVTQASGNLGSGFRFHVRGGGGLNGDEQPIIYLDGVRMDNTAFSGFGVGGQDLSVMANINPEDIASIEVLKGPAGAAEYGTSGSNGVVLITTKTGKLGLQSGTGKNYSINYKFQYGTNEKQWDYKEKDYISAKTANNAFRDGQLKSHNLSISGGIPTLRYFASLDNRIESGILPKTSQDRSSIRLNLDVAPSDNVNLDVKLGYSQSQIFRPPNDNNLIGWITATVISPNPYPWSDSAAIAAFTDEHIINNFNGSVGGSYSPIKDLEANFRFGIDKQYWFNDQTWPADQFYVGINNGLRNQYTADIKSYSGDFNLKYKYNIMNGLKATSTVGLQLFDRKFHSRSIGFANFSTALITEFGSGSDVDTKGEFKSHRRNAGIFATQYFSYLDQYFLTFAVRNDYASAVGKKAPDVFYPKASFATRLDKFDFFPKFFNLMKFRLSYGENGILPESLDGIPLLWNSSTGGYGGGALPDQIGNPAIQAERIKEFEVGLDFEFLRNYSVEFTYYNVNANKSIVDFTNSPSTGRTASPVPFNLGGVKNSGIETLIQAAPIRNSDFGLDLTLILNYQTNEVTDLGGTQPQFDDWDVNVIKEGLPKHEFYVPKVIGSSYLSDGRYNGPLLSDEPIAVGNPIPNFTGSFTVNFNFFKDFNLYVLSDWATGLKVYNDTKLFADLFGNNKALNDKFDALYALTPNTDEYKALADEISNMHYNADINYIEDADYLKIREITLSYDATDLLASAFAGSYVQNLVLGFSGRNVFTESKYSGPDPEISSDGSRSLTRGHDFYTLPQPRSYYFWFKLGF